VSEGKQALQALADSVFDVMIIDLKLPDMTGQELLRRMASGESRSFPPVIVYTGRNLTRDEEAELMRYSRSIIIKGARSPERLLDEVTLFLHKVENQLSAERQKMLRTARSRDKAFEGRRILVVDDDMRNIFALTSALEHKGAAVEVARNGIEALDKLGKTPDDVDLVLMDIMMPEMDGYTGHARDPQGPALAEAAHHRRHRQGDEGRPAEVPGCRRQRLPGQADRAGAAVLADARVDAEDGAPGLTGLADIEIRLLIEAVFLRYGHDFRDYAPASMKRRVLQAQQRMGMASISALQERVLHDAGRVRRAAAIPDGAGERDVPRPGLLPGLRRT
jgi:CheY-like chemotaxis protein